MTCHQRQQLEAPTVGAANSPGRSRVGDRERERAATVLGDASADGYLTFEELDARLSQVWAAITAAELERVQEDLPPEVRRRTGPHAATARAWTRHPFDLRGSRYVRVMLLLVLIWLVAGLTTGSWYPWPIWPALGWGLALVAHHGTTRTLVGR